MPSSYSSNLKIELIAAGEQDGTWGNITNTNLGTALEEAITASGTVVFNSADVTLGFASSNASQNFRKLRLVLTGTTAGPRNLIVPNIEKLYFIDNQTADAITVKTTAGSGIAVPSGANSVVYADSVDVVEAVTHFNSLTASSLSAVSPTFTGTPTAPTAAPGTNTTQIATTAFVQAALQALHPVGSIYINSTNATNPATLLGFGTWVAFGAGRVPVGFDAGNANFNAAEKTGGSADAIVVAHTHTGSTNTTGAHTHTLNNVFNVGYVEPYNSGQGVESNFNNSGTTGSAGNHSHTFTTDSTGSSGTNANLQPYITVFMWKRTA